MPALRARGLDKRLEVLVDGGVRRGSDVLKAVALGATGVGIGRPSLYGMASYGQDGVEKVCLCFFLCFSPVVGGRCGCWSCCWME